MLGITHFHSIEREKKTEVTVINRTDVRDGWYFSEFPFKLLIIYEYYKNDKDMKKNLAYHA